MDTPSSDTQENENELLPDDSPTLQQADQGPADWSRETPSDDRLSEEVRERLGLLREKMAERREDEES